MKAKDKFIISLLSVFLICICIGVLRAAIPLNTLRNNAGITFPYINATQAYYMGTVELVDTNFNYNGYNITQLGQYPQQESSYIVWVDGGVYFSKSGNNSEVISDIDASTIIQDAFDNGDMVYIKSGIYNLTRPLNLTEGIHDGLIVVGEGFHGTTIGTIFMPLGGINCFNVTSNNHLFQSFSIIGSDSGNGYGFLFNRTAKRNYLDHISIQDMGGDGVHIQYAWQIYIKNCQIGSENRHGNNGAGINITGDVTTHGQSISIIDSQIINNTIGIDVIHARDLRIERNSIEKSTLHGIDMGSGGAGAVLIQNHIENNGGDGLRVNNYDHVVAIQNRIFDSGGDGLYFHYSTDCQFLSNVMESNGGVDFSAGNLSPGSVIFDSNVYTTDDLDAADKNQLMGFVGDAIFNATGIQTDWITLNGNNRTSWPTYDQGLNTTEDVTFHGVSTNWISLGGDNQTTWPSGGGGLTRLYEYIITLSGGSVTVYENDGSNYTEVDDIKAFNWVTGNLTNGGSVFVKRPSDGSEYSFSSLPWLITNDYTRIYSDGATLSTTNIIYENGGGADFPAPSWALIHINASHVELSGLIINANGDTETTTPPDNIDERAAITCLPGDGGLFSANMVDLSDVKTDLYIHDVKVVDAWRVGIFICKYDDVKLINVDVEDVYSTSGRKGIVLARVDGFLIDQTYVNLNTSGYYHGSSNCIFLIRSTFTSSIMSGVRNGVLQNFRLEGSTDSSIELLGGTAAKENSNYNILIRDGIINGRGCYISQNAYNISVEGVTMYYCGGLTGHEEGAGGFQAGHNAGSSNTQSVHDITFSNCWVYLINGTLREAFKHQSQGGIVKDITIKDCGVVMLEDYQASDLARGIHIDGSSTGAPNHTSGIIIDNFYCNSVGPGVEIDGTVAEARIWIRNSEFINMGQSDAGNYYGVKIDGAGYFYLHDDVFYDETGYMDYGVAVTSSADGKFLRNQVNCTTGLSLAAAAGDWDVAWNDFEGCTTDVADAGADSVTYGDNYDQNGNYDEAAEP